MPSLTTIRLALVALTSTQLPLASAAPAASAPSHQVCRHLPSDPQWPSHKDWDTLNRTVGGRLIAGKPLAQPCHGPDASEEECATVAAGWGSLPMFLADPVNGMNPASGADCDPIFDPTNSTSCTMGRLASYAINVTDAATAAAGIKFARDRNIRLTVKNTGHDYLGRSAGAGSLALWTHDLKSISILDYASPSYTGQAVRIGAGVEVLEMYEAASSAGLRVVGGSCPTVGAAGGWTQGGGHGPLSGAYGLGADAALEFEVVTTDGRHLNASATENTDLYYALSGGGAANYAVVLSVTVKAHEDGPVAGSRLSFTHADRDVFYAAVEAWMKHLLVLDTIPGMRTVAALAQASLSSDPVFTMNVATLPGGTESDMTAALQPFYETLQGLGIQLSVNETTLDANFIGHYLAYNAEDVYTRNVTVGNRLVPRDFVRDGSGLPSLVGAVRAIVESDDVNQVSFLSQNVTLARVGNNPGANAVPDTWRDSLFLANIALVGSEISTTSELDDDLAVVNQWQDSLAAAMPGSGGYINEATYNNPNWKEDYYQGTYERLLEVKEKYDPHFVLWNVPGVGSDAYVLHDDGRLCAA